VGEVWPGSRETGRDVANVTDEAGAGVAAAPPGARLGGDEARGDEPLTGPNHDDADHLDPVREPRRRVPALVGPTASGKSAAAMALAEELGLEVVSADAMQVYRGLDIGTAKPTPEERRRVTHHLVDVVDPDERFSVARFVDLAEGAIADVFSRGRVPLVVGGTGFYLRALREGVPTAPEADPERQAPLWRAVAEGRLDELVAELEAASPADAARAARNPRRVVRSVEVLRLTGRPPSAFPTTRPRFAYEVFLLDPPADELRRRIAKRARRQFEEGLVEEVRSLLERYPELPTARQSIGYKEVVAHVRGEASLEEAVVAVTVATARYAKRQRTWFRREPGVHRLPLTGEAAVPLLRARLVEMGLVGRGRGQ